MFSNLITKVPGSVVAVLMLLGLGDAALAQGMGSDAANVGGAVGGAGGTLGDVFCNVYQNTKPFGNIFQWAAYIIGIVCTLRGIQEFRAKTDGQQGAKLSTALMLWFGAATLLALPSVVGTIVSSIYGTPSSGGITSCSPGGGGGAASTLDVMLANFVTNIKGPLVSFTSIVAIVCGLYMIIRGLFKASQHGFDPRSHSIHHILTYIVFGALLVTIGDNLNMMVASVFGNGGIGTSSVINWSFLDGLSGGASDKFKTAVIAGLTFIQLIGAIAFVRGWLIMKKVVEGAGNHTMAQGVTHILGGVLAINIFTMLKIFDNTFGTGML